MRRIIQDAGDCAGPFDAELWASHMLGTMWEQRTELPLDEREDYALIFGEPLVEGIARMGGPGARLALTAIAEVDDGELALVARGLVDRLPALESDPSWLPQVGQLTPTSAAVMREDDFDDGCTVFLEARHTAGDTHTVGVYIDNNLGVMAHDILLAESIEHVAEVIREHPSDDGELRLEPIEPAAAAARILMAMDLTEMTLDAPVSEEYPALRALATMFAGETPRLAFPEPQEMSIADRGALLDEFLSAPEGRAFAADGEEAQAVSLAIDFCADYVDGRPLRWSPGVVEMFMAGWMPDKVLADGDLLAAVPAALDAWVRFAGRKRGIPEWAIETTCAGIPGWRDEMMEAAKDPSSGGVAKQFLMAAQEAGIDVSDAKALTTFMAGWNARSTVT